MRHAPRHRARTKCSQCCRAILDRQAADHAGIEVVAVQGFRRGLIEPVMIKQLRQQALMGAPGRGEPAACIVGPEPVSLDPFVYRPVCRAGVERDQRAILGKLIAGNV